MSFSQLSVELIYEVFENLVDHHPTLWSLCLVGNRTIFLIAQKLLWREIHWKWNVSLLEDEGQIPETTRQYQQQLVNYCSNVERTKAARYMDLELFGNFSGDYSSNFWDILDSELPKFINITHLCMNLFGVVADFPSANTVGVVLHRLPALTTLRLEGCKAMEDDFEARIPLPELECLQLWYCDGDYTCLARDSPNLRILEFMSGDGEEFWRTQRNGVGEFGGYDNVHSTFSSHWMRKKAEQYPDSEDDATGTDDEPTRELKTLTRLAVCCDCTEKCWDAMDIVIYIQSAIPHPDLEELIIRTPLWERDYRKIMDYLIAPALEVLYITISKARPISFDAPRSPETPQISFKDCPELCDLWLPCTGLDVDIVFQHFALADNSKLAALCFDDNDVPDIDYVNLAILYGQRLPKLKFVAWKDKSFCRIQRREEGMIVIDSQGWHDPPWLKLNGMGSWRDN